MLSQIMTEANVGLLIAQLAAIAGHLLVYFGQRRKDAHKQDIDRQLAKAEIEEHQDEVAAASRKVFIDEFHALVKMNEVLRTDIATLREDNSTLRKEISETRDKVNALVIHVSRLEAHLAAKGADVPPRPTVIGLGEK